MLRKTMSNGCYLQYIFFCAEEATWGGMYLVLKMGISISQTNYSLKKSTTF